MVGFNVLPAAMASAIMAAAAMLILSLLALAVLYEGAAGIMEQWHAFYNLTPGGIIGGMAEAAIITFVVIADFGWTYNQIERRQK